MLEFILKNVSCFGLRDVFTSFFRHQSYPSFLHLSVSFQSLNLSALLLYEIKWRSEWNSALGDLVLQWRSSVQVLLSTVMMSLWLRSLTSGSGLWCWELISFNYSWFITQQQEEECLHLLEQASIHWPSKVLGQHCYVTQIWTHCVSKQEVFQLSLSIGTWQETKRIIYSCCQLTMWAAWRPESCLCEKSRTSTRGYCPYSNTVC